MRKTIERRQHTVITTCCFSASLLSLVAPILKVASSSSSSSCPTHRSSPKTISICSIAHDEYLTKLNIAIKRTIMAFIFGIKVLDKMNDIGCVGGGGFFVGAGTPITNFFFSSCPQRHNWNNDSDRSSFSLELDDKDPFHLSLIIKDGNMDTL